MLDNYDSFTYNLAHYFEAIGVELDVVRNDVVDIDLNRYGGVVLSPGPGLPVDAGKMMGVIKSCDSKIPVLGVCLGMQGIAIYLGGELYNLKEVKHGVSEVARIQGGELFEGIEGNMNVGLYHSWAIAADKGDFTLTAFSENGVVMAMENSARKFYGVQFHPESIMTEHGKEILANFLSKCLK